MFDSVEEFVVKEGKTLQQAFLGQQKKTRWCQENK